MPFPLTLKSKPDYVDLDADFKPLPKHGHLTQPHEEYAAVQPMIDVMYDQIWALPDFDAFRQVGRGADAAVPPGGPDRARDVVTEFWRFPARDGHAVELKVYKSPGVQRGATLMLRMHGGGELSIRSIYEMRSLLKRYWARIFKLILVWGCRLVRWGSRGRWGGERLCRRSAQYRCCQCRLSFVRCDLRNLGWRLLIW